MTHHIKGQGRHQVIRLQNTLLLNMGVRSPEADIANIADVLINGEQAVAVNKVETPLC